MKKILVSGGAGYGPVVLDSLVTGHREAVSEDIPFYQGDIADEGLVTEIINKEKISAVIHFAARSLVGESVQKPDLYLKKIRRRPIVLSAPSARRREHHCFFLDSGHLWQS